MVVAVHEALEAHGDRGAHINPPAVPGDPLPVLVGPKGAKVLGDASCAHRDLPVPPQKVLLVIPGLRGGRLWVMMYPKRR